MKNIIFLIDTLEIGGAENSLLSIYENLNSEYNISIIVLKSASKKLNSDLNLSEIKSKYIFSLISIFSLIKLLNKRRSSILISFAPEIAFIANIANLFLFRKHKIVLSFRNSLKYYSDFNKFYVCLLFFVACLPSHAFHFLTQSNKSSYEKIPFLKFLLNKKKSTIIPNYIRSLNYNFSIKKDLIVKPQIIFIGRLCNQKRPFDFIEFCELVNNKLPDIFTFHIFGDGPLKHHIIKNIQRKSNARDYKIYGKIDNIGLFLKNPFALIFTSSYEGQPGVIGEAISSGIPVFSYPYDSFIVNLLRKTYYSNISSQCSPESLFEIFSKEYSNLLANDFCPSQDVKLIKTIFDRFEITKSWISFLNLLSDV